MSVFDALTDPGTDALLGLAQGFGAASMPTRMPTPFGAVLGQGVGGMQQGLATGQALRRGDIQNQQAQIGLNWYKNMQNPQGQGGGMGSTMGAPAVNANGQYITSPQTLSSLAMMLAGQGKDPSGPLKLLESYATSGVAMGPNGNAFSVPGANAATAAHNYAAAGGTKQGEQPYVPPQEYTIQVPDSQGRAPGAAGYTPTLQKTYLTAQQANAGTSPQGGSTMSPADTSLPRGIRNNNPLNLEFREGQPGVQGSDGRFGVYPTMEDGVASNAHQLLRYGQQGVNTINGIAAKWAPAPENDPSKYAQKVSMLTGLPTDKPLNLSDPQTMTRLISGMGQVENGQMIEPGAVSRGVGMAFGAGPRAVPAALAAPGGTPPQASAASPAPVQVAGPGAPSQPGFAPLAANAAAPGVTPPAGGGGGAPLQPGGPPMQRDASGLPVAGGPAPLQVQMPQSGALPGGGMAGAPILTPQQTSDTAVNQATRIAQAQAAADWDKPIVTRAGVIRKDPTTGAITEVYRQPEYHETIDPATGREYPSFVQPNENGTLTVMGGPPVPQGQVPPTKLGPGEHELMQGSAKDFIEEGKQRYNGAATALTQLDQLDANIAALNEAGWSSTGAGANAKMGLSKWANSVSSTLGGPPIVPPDKIGYWEDAIKLQKQFGAAQSRALGSHEAAQITNMMVGASPGAENTASGYLGVSSGNHEVNNREMDNYSFQNHWAQTHGGNLIGAEAAFNKTYTPEMYGDRAISMVKPFNVKVDVNDPNGLQEFNKQTQQYLPGTRVMINGNPDIVKIVPARTDAPIPPYIQRLFMQPQGAPNGR